MFRAKRVENDYNKNDIFHTLDQLKISQRGNNILTHFGGALISDSTVTEKYELFDFPTFAKDIVSEVGNYFTPEKYQMRITKGQQELRLIGEEVIINGDKYSKMFNILNSTDKSRALQLNIGLIRFICTNGMVIAVDNEYSGLKTKHFKSTLPGKVEKFIEKLGDFNVCINKQSTTIESLQGRFVSFKEISKKLALDEKQELVPGGIQKLRAFGKKLIESNTDKIVNLQSEQATLLRNPQLFLNPEFKNIDIEMSAYQALNCWTEVYRNYDSSILKRETSRILELV
jgi:hypothetical protein